MSFVALPPILELVQVGYLPAIGLLAGSWAVRSMTIPCVTMDTPIPYRIKVSGLVSGQWSAYYDGMELEVQYRDGKYPLTTLTGRVADQTALLGMLGLLHDLRCALISVDCLMEE